MNELVKVDFDTQTVSARDLYSLLNVSKRFSAWFETNSQGFVNGVDFEGAYLKVQSNQFGGEKEIQDYRMTVDMAKHFCLMSRTEKGKECRQYLIDLEKAWNTSEQVMARALKIANNTIDSLKSENNTLAIENKEMRPKAIFADAVSTSHTSILIGDLAKLICQNGYQIGQKRLFEVKESSVQNPDGSVRITRTTKVTGKGQIYFVNKFIERSIHERTEEN